MRPDIKRKFWVRVLEALDNIKETSAYFVGGTLCIPLEENVCINLNLDGKGFVLNSNHPLEGSRSLSLTIYQPEEVLDKVRDVYINEKGMTEHFKEAVCY